MLLGWSSLLIASVSYTAADSDGNTETHSPIKDQFVPPHIQHDVPYTTDYGERVDWSPLKVSLHWRNNEKQAAADNEEDEPVIQVQNRLQKIEEGILKVGGDKVGGGRLEKRGSLFPALRKAPLLVQVLALLQLCVSLAALGVSFLQGSRILFPSIGDSNDWHTETNQYISSHPSPE